MVTLGQVKAFNVPLSNFRDAWCQREETFSPFAESLQRSDPGRVSLRNIGAGFSSDSHLI